MPDIADVYKIIMDETQATGTVAYGLEAEDIDRFASPAVVDKVKGLLDYLGVYYAECSGREGGSGGACYRLRFKLPMMDKPIDLFAVANDEIVTFKVVTDMVTMAARHMPGAAQQKALRVHLFRMLRNEFKLWRECAPVATAVGHGA